MKRKVFLVLPTYNEEGNIGRLLDRIEETMNKFSLTPYEIILIDDGSNDSTEKIVSSRSKKMPIIFEKHDKNMGLGATIRDGLYTASKLASDRDILITMDADDTHTPKVIIRMVRMISEGYCVVIASRFQPGSKTIGVPLIRKILSFGASWLFRLIMPINGVRDYTCGYRAYSSKVIKNAINRYGKSFIDQDGFQCMVDILLKFRKTNITFGEVPLILRYDSKKGKSKMNIPATIKNTMVLLIKRRLGI
ncbi:glycosyltransferase [Candidatus Borrarchaeum sp.]|uniref:glycosyltransferase n=1 Tax=Candidatus Borrarchaeum sp. TaxID=2846742 RepID=UPI00257E700B|nr:glycosyltransferase [Candidatus Borrarchaeum sp.]